MFENGRTIMFNSIIAALFVNTACLTQILVAAYPSFGGSFMTILYVLCVICFAISCLFLQRSHYFMRNSPAIFMAFLFVFLYYMTSAFIGTPYTKGRFFLMFTIISFLIPSFITINTRSLLLTIIYSSLLGTLYLDKIFILDYNKAISMGESYAFLVPSCAAICYLFTYLKEDHKFYKIINIIVIIINLVYVVYIFQYGSRGPSLCILMLLVFFFVCNFSETNYHINKKRLMMYAVVALALYLSFIPIMTQLSNFLNFHFNLSLNVIDKFIYLSDKSEITNGRAAIADIAISGINDHPLLGHGIDQFSANTGINYPHNFVLQMCYDLGCVFTFIFLLYICQKVRNTFKTYNKSNAILAIFMAFSSVPGALFSNDLWNNIALWSFFGCAFSRTFCYKIKRYD